MNVTPVCSSCPRKWLGHLVARAESGEQAAADSFSKAGSEEVRFFVLFLIVIYFGKVSAVFPVQVLGKFTCLLDLRQ